MRPFASAAERLAVHTHDAIAYGNEAAGVGWPARPQNSDAVDAVEAEAKARHDQFIAVDLLLLAMTKSTGSVGKILKKAGVEPAPLDAAIDEMRKGRTADSDAAEDSYDALSRYTSDLTEAARNGKLDPVIVRDAEVRRTIQILARRTKNNQVLICQLKFQDLL